MNRSFTPDLELLTKLLSTAPDAAHDECAATQLQERTWLVEKATAYVSAFNRLNATIDALPVPLSSTVAAFLDEVQR